MKSARAWSVLNTYNKLSQIDVITKRVVKPFTPAHERPYSSHGSLYVPLILTRRICMTIRRLLDSFILVAFYI